jgi:serine/threonine-protein kinase RsbW
MHAMSDFAAVETMESDGTRSVHLRIPAKAEYITLCRLALTGLAQLRSIPDDTMADLKLALTEAVSNSVRHAYGPEGEGSVDVRYELHPDRLGIAVVDDGAGFDPDDPRERGEQTGEELTEGGLGIAIIKSIADEFELTSKPGVRGSTLRFVKKLS